MTASFLWLAACLGAFPADPSEPASGLTAVALQLASGVDDPQAAARALARGLTAAGEPAVVASGSIPPTCPAEPSCLERLQRLHRAPRILFLVLIGLADEVQVAVTRVEGLGPPEDLDPIIVPRPGLSVELERRAKGWARPPALVEVPPPAPLSPPVAVATGPSPPVLVAAGVSGASLIAAGVLGAIALSTQSSLRADGCDRRPCDPGRVDALAREAGATDALLATAAISAVAGVVLWWLEEGEP